MHILERRTTHVEQATSHIDTWSMYVVHDTKHTTPDTMYVVHDTKYTVSDVSIVQHLELFSNGYITDSNGHKLQESYK